MTLKQDFIPIAIQFCTLIVRFCFRQFLGLFSSIDLFPGIGKIMTMIVFMLSELETALFESCEMLFRLMSLSLLLLLLMLLLVLAMALNVKTMNVKKLKLLNPRLPTPLPAQVLLPIRKGHSRLFEVRQTFGLSLPFVTVLCF